MPVFMERQRQDSSFAVYVGGNDDIEGSYDQLFSYGKIDGRTITVDEARGAAMAYAQKIGKKFGGIIERRE